MTPSQNWRAGSPSCTIFARRRSPGSAIYWLRFNLEFRDPYYPDMVWMLAWIVPLQGALFLAFGLYRGLVAVREHARPAADRARGGLGRAPHSARPRDAAAADGGAAQRARLLSDRADLPHGGRSLRLPDLEGASALQPAARAGRARARRRRRRSRRAAHRTISREAGSGAWSGFSTTIRQAGPAAAQRQRAGADREPAGVGEQVRRAQGHHRAALGRARRAPPRRGNLRRQSASKRSPCRRTRI